MRRIVTIVAALAVLTMATTAQAEITLSGTAEGVTRLASDGSYEMFGTYTDPSVPQGFGLYMGKVTCRGRPATQAAQIRSFVIQTAFSATATSSSGRSSSFPAQSWSRSVSRALCAAFLWSASCRERRSACSAWRCSISGTRRLNRPDAGTARSPRHTAECSAHRPRSGRTPTPDTFTFFFLMLIPGSS